MFKKLLPITFLAVIFFLSCKKDPPLYPTPTHTIAETIIPFELKNEVYPNPCRGTFTIKTNTTDSQSVILANSLGVQILNLTINGTTAIVNNNLINGIYFLSISSKHGKSANKIIVSK